VGVRLFLEGKGRVLSIGGTGHPEAGVFPPEVSSIVHNRSLFHIVHQSLVEEAIMRGAPVPEAIQIRGRTPRPGDSSDGVLVTLDTLSPTETRRRSAVQPWLQVFQRIGWSIEIQPHDATGGFEIDHALQSRYRRLLGVEAICGLWINSGIRYSLRGDMLDPAGLAALEQLGFVAVRDSMTRWWKKEEFQAELEPPPEMADVVDRLARFQLTGNLGDLSAAGETARSRGWETRVFQDESAGATVVVLRSGPRLIAANATAYAGSARAPSSVSIEDFLRLRRLVIFGRRGP
jgi:hypothetical protein